MSAASCAGFSESSLPSASSASFKYLICASIYACGVLFLVPGIIAGRRIARNWSQDHTAVRLYGLLVLGSTLRAVAFVLVALWMLSRFCSHDFGRLDRKVAYLHLSYAQLVFIWQVLGTSASLVLGGVFLLVFNTWATMVDEVQINGHAISSKIHRVGDRATESLLQSLHTPNAGEMREAGVISAIPDSSLKFSPPPRALFTRLVVTVYLLRMGTILFAKQKPGSKMRQSLLLVAIILLVCCWAACVILLPAYGKQMCVLLDKVAEDVTSRKRNIRRIAVISAVFCFMHLMSSFLLAASQTAKFSGEASSSIRKKSSQPSDFPLFLQNIVEAYPGFFFPSGTEMDMTANTNDRLLSWILLLESLKFPTEWAMLMALLCVLPARSALPAFRGYQPIPDRSKWPL